FSMALKRAPTSWSRTMSGCATRRAASWRRSLSCPTPPIAFTFHDSTSIVLHSVVTPARGAARVSPGSRLAVVPPCAHAGAQGDHEPEQEDRDARHGQVIRTGHHADAADEG